MANHDWGTVLVGTRLEKQVSSRFFQVWTDFITRGIAPGDAVLSVRGKVAHKAANDLVRQFLGSPCDSLLFVDSDAVFDADIVEQFRRYEPGFDYDVLQAFYCRRGWPPTPIWMKRNPLGVMTDTLVTRDYWVDDVDTVGLHCTIVRRAVFETMLGENDPATFEWFFYPRHERASEDAAWSDEALAAGFRLGATTAIKTGHLGDLVTDWGSYQDWMRMTGRDKLVQRYSDLAQLIAAFTGEEADLVIAKSLEGTEGVREAWQRHAPQTADEVRAFYGAPDNGYLYNLLQWNCQPLYARIIAPLWQMADVHALVIGAGLGTEVEALLAGGGNVIDVYELPGVLRQFVAKRFSGLADSWLWILPDWEHYNSVCDVVVAVDVLEHVHADDLGALLERIDKALCVGGQLVLHAAWGQGSNYPQHYDHREIVEAWLARRYERKGEFLWQKLH